MMEKPEQILNKTQEYSVSQVSELLKTVVETAFANVRIKGEITGLKKHSSGNYYFDLKENFGGKDYVIKGVIWKWTKLSIIPEEGMEAVAVGKLTTYTGGSYYQITIADLELAGVGALLKQIQLRKEKLEKEGLFDQSRKKKIPFFPEKIAVITSPTGAVIRDIIHRIRDRFPTNILVYPTAVQGQGAELQIADAIDKINTLIDKPDVIIVARGGGSLQDLMCFNEEIVVRAVANSGIPIISAVGHETDTTLIDFAADLRAPTPTGAAELATPMKSDLIENLKTKDIRINRSILSFLENKKLMLQAKISKILTPQKIIEDYIRRCDEKADKLKLFIKNKIQLVEHKLKSASSLLESYSYKNVLKRGYIIAKDGLGKIITSSKNADKINQLVFFDGVAKIKKQ